jgi:hypothetical protein
VSNGIAARACAVVAAVLVTGSGVAAAAPRATAPVRENACELRHEVEVRFPEPDLAVFTVTRTYQAIGAAGPMRLVRELEHAAGVVTSFSLRAGGEPWREATWSCSRG